MKTGRILIMAVLALMAFVPAGCGHSHSEHAHGSEGHDHDAEVADGKETHEAEGHHGDEIVVEPETARRFGVETAVVKADEFNDVIKVTGQILDTPLSSSVVSAPTAGIVRFATGMQEGRSVGAGTVVATVKADGISGGDANRAHKAAVDAAKRELDRLRPLYDEGIVSAKDYNAALEAYEVALSQYSGTAASGAAKAVSAGMISQLLVANGQYVEAGAPIATISANSRLTLRADVPDRYASQLPLVKSARISVPHSGEVIDLSEMGATRVSSAGATRVSPGYIPVFFSFDSKGRVLPQTLAEVYLIGTQRSGVISVPRDAIVEQQGQHFVFVKVDEEGYQKRAVRLGASDGRRVELLDGVKEGENLVVKGAMTVKLAESGAAVPEGHSHSH